MIFRNIPIKHYLIWTIWSDVQKKRKKKKKGHHVKVYFKFVCPSFLRSFTALPKDFKSLAAMVAGVIFVLTLLQRISTFFDSFLTLFDSF